MFSKKVSLFSMEKTLHKEKLLQIVHEKQGPMMGFWKHPLHLTIK